MFTSRGQLEVLGGGTDCTLRCRRGGTEEYGRRRRVAYDSEDRVRRVRAPTGRVLYWVWGRGSSETVPSGTLWGGRRDGGPGRDGPWTQRVGISRRQLWLRGLTEVFTPAPDGHLSLPKGVQWSHGRVTATVCARFNPGLVRTRGGSMSGVPGSGTTSVLGRTVFKTSWPPTSQHVSSVCTPTTEPPVHTWRRTRPSPPGPRPVDRWRRRDQPPILCRHRRG